MSKLQNNIADLEAILTNSSDDYSQDELRVMEEDLIQFRYLDRLWAQFCSIPLNNDGRRLTAEFHPIGPNGEPSATEKVFEKGALESTVLAWFESRFCISVKNDLGYTGPWKNNADCAGCRNNRPHARTIPSVCLRCRRQYPGYDAFNDKPDFYEPYKGPSAGSPAVNAEPAPACGMVITKPFALPQPFTVTVPLSDTDINGWIGRCTDVQTLERLINCANYRIRDLKNGSGGPRSET